MLGLALLPAPAPATCSDAVLDRSLGALLGLAAGDAVGTTLEFSRRDSKPAPTGMVGGGPFRLRPGEWTDDTAWAPALADSLVADASLDAGDLMRRFVDRHRTGSYSCTGRCFDIGMATQQALARFERDETPYAGSTGPMGAGNGSLMRRRTPPQADKARRQTSDAGSPHPESGFLFGDSLRYHPAVNSRLVIASKRMRVHGAQRRRDGVWWLLAGLMVAGNKDQCGNSRHLRAAADAHLYTTVQ